MSTTGPDTDPPASVDKSPAKVEEKKKRDTNKKNSKRNARTAVDELTAEEREAVTIVFHQYETGLREGTIFTKVINSHN